jgi:hypothetical protein
LSRYESNISDTFSFFDENDSSDDGPDIARNYTATTWLEGGCYDLEKIIVTVFGVEEGKKTEGEYDVYADAGIMHSLVISL